MKLQYVVGLQDADFCCWMVMIFVVCNFREWILNYGLWFVQSFLLCCCDYCPSPRLYLILLITASYIVKKLGFVSTTAWWLWKDTVELDWFGEFFSILMYFALLYFSLLNFCHLSLALNFESRLKLFWKINYCSNIFRFPFFFLKFWIWIIFY